MLLHGTVLLLWTQLTLAIHKSPLCMARRQMVHCITQSPCVHSLGGAHATHVQGARAITDGTGAKNTCPTSRWHGRTHVKNVYSVLSVTNLRKRVMYWSGLTVEISALDCPSQDASTDAAPCQPHVRTLAWMQLVLSIKPNPHCAKTCTAGNNQVV